MCADLHYSRETLKCYFDGIVATENAVVSKYIPFRRGSHSFGADPFLLVLNLMILATLPPPFPAGFTLMSWP